MRGSSIAVLALLFATSHTTTAFADWPAGGKLVSIVDDSFNGIRLTRVMELPSGEFYLLTVGNGGNANGYSLQRLSPTGDIAAGWPANGFILGQVGKSESPSLMGFTVDDTAAVWRAAYTQSSPSRITAKVARPEPFLYSPWPASSTTGSPQGAAASPAPGGAYIAFGSRLQRMTRSGTVAPGWPANGVTGLASFGLAAAPDGADGVILFASGFGAPSAKRFDPTGALHAGWPSPLVLSSDPDDQMADINTPGKLVRSGADHFIAGWVTPVNSVIQRFKLQRFSSSGTLDPAWPANGILAIPADTITSVTLIPDGLGGAHALWIAHKRPYGVHVRADGTIEPGTAGGVDLAGGDPSYQVPYFFLTQYPEVVADEASGGRLIFAYDDYFGGSTPQYHVRWLLPDYTADPAEPARIVNPAARGRSVRLVHHDGVGGAYLGWEADPANPPDGFADREFWMTRLLPSSLLGVSPRAGAKLALGRPSPNPARDAVTLAVTLPDDSPARVELLDVAGRVVRSQLVQGAGPHAITLDALGSIAPGLYFARVTSRDRSSSVRVAVSR